ncbi:unnamed protein product, partial [Hydatigera taeniaeformis]|uniref:Radial spoke head protein 4 A n=1 Tax=Hydatigena taeniaeformis TaxID=6205 RepID=A0A158REG4_HYDTA
TPNPKTGGFCDLGPEEPPEKEFEKAKALFQSIQHGGSKKHEGLETDSQTCTLYEHMVGIAKYILEHQPVQALDQFEELSRLVKREMGLEDEFMNAGFTEAREDAVANTKGPKPPEVVFAEAERAIYRHPDHVWNKSPLVEPPLPASYASNFEEDEEEMAAIPNLCEQLSLIEQSGIGLGGEELTRIGLALRFLWKVLQDSVTKLRFWGKIYGQKSDYYIVEAEFEGDSEPIDKIPGPWDKWRLPKPPKVIQEQDTEEFKGGSPLEENLILIRKHEGGRGTTKVEVAHKQFPIAAMLLKEETVANLPVEKRVLINLPKNKFKPPTRYPREPRGRGLNRWDYFVSNSLGDDTWVRLPIVKPEHVVAARQSIHFFTGDLNAPVGELPCGVGPFPGLEVHYLRAQIARISSGTQVSPAGVFELDEEDEPEEGEKPENLLMAEEYEPMEFADLLDPSNWVHHRPFIYSIGRINWLSSKKAAAAMKAIEAEEEGEDEGATPRADNDEEAMEEEGEEEEEEEEEEEGPDLLTPVDEDNPLKPLGRVGESFLGHLNSAPASAWNVRPSTVLFPVNCAIAVISSSRWPGAYALSRSTNFVNIYLGWGNKFLGASYQPPRLQPLSKEFDEDAVGLKETMDPTVQQEEEERLRKEARRNMVDSASELDLESDASSIDGHTGRCEQLQRQVELLQQQNRMLKTEVDQLTLRVKGLAEKNEQLRRNSVSILAQAEREEEYISNTLQRQISELKKDKESLVVKFEEEEERLINELNRKLTQLQKDKDKLERTLAKEQEAQVNKLKRRIERLESESEWKQQILDKLRRDKIELENALEQEQEALVNRLWKKMKKLEDEKRILQDKLESVSAPPSESPSVQNISAVAVGGANQTQHLASIPMAFIQTSQNRHSAGGSLRGSLRIPTTDALGRSSFDSFESSGCQSDNAGQSPTHSGARGSLTSSISPRPSQSPMELDVSLEFRRIHSTRSHWKISFIDASLPTGSLVRSDSSQSGSRSHRNSFQPSNASVAELTAESTVAGAAYVAKLREEVIRLRRIVAVTQAEQVLRSNQERSAMDENARLRQLLEVEVDRTRALTRALSDSESSLEIEDERCYNDARRFATSSIRLRTTSDGCPSPLVQGPFLGPGHAYAAAVFQGRNNSGRVCRECGQPLPPYRAPYHCGAVTPPPSSPSPGSFVKPSPHIRPPHSIRQSNASATVTTTGCVTSAANVPTRHSANTSEGEEEDDERSKTPPASMTD